jgi:hypothetical protein
VARERGCERSERGLGGIDCGIWDQTQIGAFFRVVSSEITERRDEQKLVESTGLVEVIGDGFTGPDVDSIARIPSGH